VYISNNFKKLCMLVVIQNLGFIIKKFIWSFFSSDLSPSSYWITGDEQQESTYEKKQSLWKWRKKKKCLFFCIVTSYGTFGSIYFTTPKTFVTSRWFFRFKRKAHDSKSHFTVGYLGIAWFSPLTNCPVFSAITKCIRVCPWPYPSFV